MDQNTYYTSASLQHRIRIPSTHPSFQSPHYPTNPHITPSLKAAPLPFSQTTPLLSPLSPTHTNLLPHIVFLAHSHTTPHDAEAEAGSRLLRSKRSLGGLDSSWPWNGEQTRFWKGNAQTGAHAKLSRQLWLLYIPIEIFFSFWVSLFEP